MNKLISITFFSILCIACNSIKDQDVTTSVKLLKESYITKNEKEFLNQFPKDFNQFVNYFGRDSINNKQKELCDSSNDYIDYWFELLNNDKHKDYENSIIKICLKEVWETDAVYYFHYKSLNYIKENQKYYLINNLSNIEAKTVLYSLFESPHPQYDEDFIFNLDPSKKDILNNYFETKFNEHTKYLLENDTLSINLEKGQQEY